MVERCAALLALLFVLGWAWGCRRDGEAGEERLEAVDVAPALTVETAADPAAVERPPELIGALPAGFPDDLPLYLPASLIDFGTGKEGRFVSLLTPHGLARVEGQVTAQLRQAGWTATGSGAGTWTLRKGSRRVRLTIEDAKPGTFYRFEY